MHENTLILIEVGALLLGMSLLGRLALRIGISPIPLYLIAGLAFGNGGLLALDASTEFFEIGADIGVILLLALLGLEYTASELFTNLKHSRMAGLLDAALNALPGAIFALLMGWGPAAAVALAGITWVSSS
ncbi:MAG: cation:proton antiporter, partial [Microterricola sp.]